MKKKLMLLFFVLTAAVAFAVEPSLSATWSVDMVIAGNSTTSTLVLKQDGEKLSGTIKKNTDEKETAVKGEVKGTKVSWEYASDYEGNPLTIKFSGTAEAAGVITGTVEVQPMGIEGSFTAKKVEVKK